MCSKDDGVFLPEASLKEAQNKHPQAGSSRRWSNLGLLVAVTAGFWCLAAGLAAPASAHCMFSDPGAGAGTDCRGDASAQLALLRTGSAARAETDTSSWPPLDAKASAQPLIAAQALDGWQSHPGRQSAQSSPQFPLYHVAPKQSPPGSVG
ncbi:hypothetical protein FIV42_20560 [Persicimonas caeni]|uniref:Uncharacterized protein n=1 Tax=Persicimonas caeni TaxID=2292766 RepID=A0A4Y6PXI7_PERCE|nr:hypothetical protein [Persicimonas caeni]QDG53048.1 hypothetical protein FIV42_20560 [Persicimonas caeni]QED34270.1 hypothetical protein FRD00_20555 [Persicimonas caeni]